MFNPATFSSLLFLLPAIYAYPTCIDVTVTSLVCVLTSYENHSRNCSSQIWRYIDFTTVRLIATAYVIHTILTIGLTPGALLVYAASVLTVALYINISRRPYLYNYHPLIHVSATAGMTAYVFARKHTI